MPSHSENVRGKRSVGGCVTQPIARSRIEEAGSRSTSARASRVATNSFSGMAGPGIAALLSLALVFAPAYGQECVAREPLTVLIGVDASGSMRGRVSDGDPGTTDPTRLAVAKVFVLALLDELGRTGRVSEAKAFFFCKILIDQSAWGTTASVRDFVNLSLTDACPTSGPTAGTALDASIVAGADELRLRRSSGRRLLVILSDGEDTEGSAISPITALAPNDVFAELVHAGTGSSPLSYLHRPPQVNVRTASFAALGGIVRPIVDATCTNHRPQARLNVMPASLQLGTDTPVVTLDASLSSDVEDSSLTYTFEIRRPNGDLVTTSGPSGTSSFIWNVRGLIPEDFSGLPWTGRVTVGDRTGTSGSATRNFEILGGPPIVDIDAPGVARVGDRVVFRNRYIDDLDGGPLTYLWEVLSAPDGAQFSAGQVWRTPTVEFSIGEGDISHPSDGTDPPFDTPWSFRLTLTDDERDTASGQFDLVVPNEAPTGSIAPVDAIYSLVDPFGVPQTPLVELTVDGGGDPDGGVPDFFWDVVQAPVSGFRGAVPDLEWAAGPTVSPSFGPAEAGYWIVRLRVTDDEGEEVEDEVRFLIDAPVVADIAPAREQIGQLLEELTLDGSGSHDPDSDCPAGVSDCFVNIEGPVEPAPTGGVVRHLWRVADVLLEDGGSGEVYRGYPVADVLALPGSGPMLTIPAGTLDPGEWTFELEVEDGEGNVDYAQHVVEVIPETSKPIAITGPPRRYLLDLTRTALETIEVDGRWSFDPDNFLSGDPLPGIRQYEWTPLLSTGCPWPLPASTAGVELFTAGRTVPLSCHGTSFLGLTVRDDDDPRMEDTAVATLIIGTCDEGVCVDYPRKDLKARVEYAENTDILIYYHVNSGLLTNPSLASGLVAHLEIFHESRSEPVFKAWGPNAWTTLANPLLVFHWDGRWFDGSRPRRGRYSLRVSLLDGSMIPAPGFFDREDDAILIEVTDLLIDTAATRYVALDNLRDGAERVSIPYRLEGRLVPDAMEWRVTRKSDGMEIYRDSLPSGSSGAVDWDGRLSVRTGAPLIEPGEYTVTLEAFAEGRSLTGKVKRDLTVYDLHVETPTGERLLSALVNDDDDDLNGQRDGTQIGAVPLENDLLPLRIVMDPLLEGRISIASARPGMLELFTDEERSGAISLPGTVDLPSETIPDAVYLEAEMAGEAEIELTFTPAGATALSPVRNTVRQVAVSLEDKDGARVDEVRIARLLNAYRSPSDNTVLDTASDPFVDRENRRFAVRIDDPVANVNPSSGESVTVRVGVIDITGIIFDDMTPTTAIESDPSGAPARDTGSFLTLAQILTTLDLPTDADDDQPTHDGSARRTDDVRNDRSHQASIDSHVEIRYRAAPSPIDLSHTVPVCGRGPNERKLVDLQFVVFNNPDTGVPYASQAYVDDLIERANIAWAPACLEFVTTSPIIFQDAPSATPPGGVTPLNILADQMFQYKIATTCDHTDCRALLAAFSLDETPDKIYVFVVPDIPAGAAAGSLDPAAFSMIPAAGIPGLGVSSAVVIEAGLAGPSRTLAHEMGHVLSNTYDEHNPRYIFYPQTPARPGAVPDYGYDPHDSTFGSYRRVEQTTIDDIRTDRRTAHCTTGTGGLILCGDSTCTFNSDGYLVCPGLGEMADPDRSEKGNYALEDY